MTLSYSSNIVIDGDSFRDRVKSVMRQYTEQYLVSFRDDLKDVRPQGITLPWSGMWKRLLTEILKECRTDRPGDRMETFAEDAALELIRCGVPKADVKATYRHITATLPNGRYRIYRGSGDPGRAGLLRILTPGETGDIRTGLGARELARLLLFIDPCIPDITEIMDGLSEDMYDAALEHAARRRAEEIAGKTVTSLLQDVLPAMDIDCNYMVRDGRVHLNLTKVLTGAVDLPLEELAGFLADPERILSSLSPVGVENMQDPPSGLKTAVPHARPGGFIRRYPGIRINR